MVTNYATICVYTQNGKDNFCQNFKNFSNENSHVHDSLKTGQEFTKTYCVSISLHYLRGHLFNQNFDDLIVLQPPYGSAVADKNFHDKQIRMQEVLGGITTLFKRLRVCWEKANVST